MQIKEKLEVFRDFTLDVAKENSGQLTAQYEAVCRQELEEFRKNKQTEMEHRLQMEERSLRRQMNSRVSRELLHQKHILDECKRQWKEKLAEEIKILLKEYQKTADYHNFLVSRIRMAKKVAGKEAVIIYLNASDEDQKQELEKETETKLTISKIDFGGGIRAVVRSRNILIDESFLTKLEQEEMHL